MSADIIQAQYDQLDAVAQRFAAQADACAAMQGRLTQRMQPLEQGGWQGRGRNAFFAEMNNAVLPVVQRLIAALQNSQRTTLQIRDIMRAAEEEAAEPFKTGDRGSMPLGAATIMAGAMAVGVMAGSLAAGGTGTGAGGGAGSGSSAGSRRESFNDRRVDDRIASDERWRRTPGGDRGGSHHDYDWAGGSILERYLTGSGDWTINNDPRWTQYMQQNGILTGDLRTRALQDAQEMVANGQSALTIDQSYAMSIENGEGIVGYQYLHGTNADVGGFQRQGTATVTPDGSGGFIVTMNMHYTWNDVIDPNPQYVTDTWKSRIAEVITLGQADPYTIRINWDETTVVHLDANGRPLEINNN